MALSERVLTALHSKATASADFYGGWAEEDVELLQRWVVDDGDVQVEQGLLIDWLGCRTELRNYARFPVPPEGGLVVREIPIPNDSVHADAIEYVALLTGLERARARGSAFTMLELGASYAPWAVFGALVARRAGFERIVVCAVEASESAIDRIEAHAKINDVFGQPGIDFRIQNAAVSVSNKQLFFPKVDTSDDNGAQASRSRRRVDYRGMRVHHVRVPGVTLHELTDDLDVVDFVHLDLQGGEEPLLLDKRFLDRLDKKVACMMLATHSRLIEGIAVEALANRGWRLHRERPVKFQPSVATRDVVGWTSHDGAQLWLNPKFD
jgi:FkbM family methyltransferase